jgi:hypothetical protein
MFSIITDFYGCRKRLSFCYPDEKKGDEEDSGER